MHGLEIYNWTEILQSNELRDAWAEGYHQHKSNDAKKAFTAASPEPHFIKPKLSTDEMLAMDLVFASIKPIKVDGKYSPRETLLTVEDSEVRSLIKCAAIITRSNLMTQSNTKDTRHSSLVPLFLAAQKQYNGVKYEEWNKEDPVIRLLVGRKLYDDIKPWFSVPLSKELQQVCRRNALKTATGRTIAATAWPRHTITLDSSTKLGSLNFFRHIWLQTWVANVEYRNEYMILDVNNWDLMPEALDAVFTPTPVIKKLPENDIPW